MKTSEWRKQFCTVSGRRKVLGQGSLLVGFCPAPPSLEVLRQPASCKVRTPGLSLHHQRLVSGRRVRLGVMLTVSAPFRSGSPRLSERLVSREQRLGGVIFCGLYPSDPAFLNACYTSEGKVTSTFMNL